MTALIFDCDGVLADTERDGHLPAFNRMFEEFGLPVQWSEDEYGEKLTIAGGKERMASLLTEDFVRDNGLPADPEGQRAMLAEWHRRKTEIYTEMVAAGRLPARPGVARIITRRSMPGGRSRSRRRRRKRPSGPCSITWRVPTRPPASRWSWRATSSPRRSRPPTSINSLSRGSASSPPMRS